MDGKERRWLYIFNALQSYLMFLKFSLFQVEVISSYRHLLLVNHIHKIKLKKEPGVTYVDHEVDHYLCQVEVQLWGLMCHFICISAKVASLHFFGCRFIIYVWEVWLCRPLLRSPNVDVGSDGQHLSPLALSAKLRFHFFSASVNNLRIHLQLDMSFI